MRPLQKRRRCGLVLADLDARGAAAFHHRDHPADLLLDLLDVAVALAEQDRGGLEVVAGMHEALDRGRHRLVEHLEAGRDDAGGDHVGDRVAGFPDVVEARHDAARDLRLRDQPDRRLDDHREHAFAADQHAHQVVAGRIERLRAERDRLARGGVAAHAQHVVQGQAVLQAVHAARVLGDVAADRAGDLAARIGRVVEAERRRGLADREVAHAALHRRGPRLRIEADDPVELREAQA